MRDASDVLILGGGLTGLSAATQLGDHAIVLEAQEEPGGLAQTLHIGEWWFDRVLHLLYFWDAETERIVKHLLGTDLASCPPRAYVETSAGTTLYPFQMHLGMLPGAIAARCLIDLARKNFTTDATSPANFSDMLRETFGESTCEIFMFPYNRKMWKRPLESLSPTGFQWNITRPDFEQVVTGALNKDAVFESYNASGHYPRPPPDAPVRGLSVLSRALASQLSDIRYGTRVIGIDPARRTVVMERNGRETKLHWNRHCLATLPLPFIMRCCHNVPQALLENIAQLTSNRVAMVYLGVRGPRPKNFGHWRYYADEDICFNRLVSMTDFDEHAAPSNGWSLMAEITQRSETLPVEPHALIQRVIRDARAVVALTENHVIEVSHTQLIDPAYVVFSDKNQLIMQQARDWLRSQGISPLGRYGRWEYSSMAQCMRDGFRWGRAVASEMGCAATSEAVWRGPLDNPDRT